MFADMTISASSRTYPSLPAPSMTALAQLLESHMDHAPYSLTHGGARTTYLVDFMVKPNYSALLLNCCDKSASDPIFSKPPQKQWRRVPKEDDEGVDLSCHVVIGNNPALADTYPVVIEQIPGISPVRVIAYLRKMVTIARRADRSFFMVEDLSGAKNKDGSAKMIPSFVKLGLYGHPSDELMRDLSNGTLSSLKLLSRAQAGIEWDDKGYVLEKRKVIDVDISGTRVANMAKKVVPILRQVARKAQSKGIEALRVEFETEHGLRRTVDIDPGTFDVVGNGYVRRELLRNFKRDLDSSYETLNEEIVNRMVHLLP